MFRRNFLTGALAAGLAGKQLVSRAFAAESVDGQAKISNRRFPHRAKVTQLEDLTHNIKRIRFQPISDGFAFTVGQYIRLRAPADYLAEFNESHGTNHDDVARPYSFASSPSESSYFELIIKHYSAPPEKEVPPGVVSTYIHKHLDVGDAVQLSQPAGKLYSENESDRPIITVAGGIGASPFVGLLNYWFEHQTNERRKIYFFLGVRSRRDLLLHDQFTDWSKTKSNFRYIPALSHPQEGDDWQGDTGYINVVLERYFQEPVDADAYLAGPPIMIKFTREALRKKGVNEDHVHRDPIRVGNS